MGILLDRTVARKEVLMTAYIGVLPFCPVNIDRGLEFGGICMEHSKLALYVKSKLSKIDSLQTFYECNGATA